MQDLMELLYIGKYYYQDWNGLESSVYFNMHYQHALHSLKTLTMKHFNRTFKNFLVHNGATMHLILYFSYVGWLHLLKDIELTIPTPTKCI